jgi:Fic family protein
MTSYRWSPIEDLPVNWIALASKELESLASIWKESAARLKESDALLKFNERLRREWAIETGIIENLYSIDRGITRLLIEKGIEASLIPFGTTDKPAERIVPILRDQEEVLEGLFDFVGQQRDLSTSYIKELHQALTRHQDTVEAVNGLGRLVEVALLRGEWKRQPNNPTRPDGEVHEYCPPEHVAAEMDLMIEMHRRHLAEGVPPEVEAAWLHHRFTQIHPFQDGNGRMARALASLVFLRAGWFPLVIHRDDREAYIAALEAADSGDLAPLLLLFSRVEKRAINNALSLSETVLLQDDPLGQIISAATDRLGARRQERVRKVQEQAFELAGQLESAAEQKLHTVGLELHESLQHIDQHYFALVERSNEENDFWFKKQIVDLAKQLGYYADTRTYRSWVRLKIIEDRRTEMVLSFHSLGSTFVGVMAVSAFLEHRDRGEDGETAMDGPYRLCGEVFQFSHLESGEVVVNRFNGWLNEVLLAGLDLWRSQL